MTDRPATLQDVIAQGEKIIAELAALAAEVRAIRDQVDDL